MTDVRCRCGFVGKNDTAHTIAHYKEQIRRISLFQAQHGHEWTEEDDRLGGMRPVKWGELCCRAIKFYREFIAEAKTSGGGSDGRLGR